MTQKEYMAERNHLLAELDETEFFLNDRRSAALRWELDALDDEWAEQQRKIKNERRGAQ